MSSVSGFDMDKKVELRRNRLRQIRNITEQIWQLQIGKVLRLETQLALLRQQESEILQRLGENCGVENLLISRLHDLGSQRSTIAAEIERENEVAGRLGRRAVSTERFYCKMFGKSS
jgi:hypothetical protein